MLNYAIYFAKAMWSPPNQIPEAINVLRFHINTKGYFMYSFVRVVLPGKPPRIIIIRHGISISIISTSKL